jgi:phosphomannomutase
MATKIKFGTDGWRAVIAEDFTFANLDRVTQAAADYWKQHPVEGSEKRAIVGYDRRFLSDRFARRVAEVLAGNGFAVTLADAPTPTPAVSWAVKANKAIGGVMITASHNPPEFNGFKLKAWYGGSADSAICAATEELLDASVVKWTSFEHAAKNKQIVVKDLRAPHYAACKKLVNFDLIAKSKLRFAHEALYGVGAGCFDELLAGTTCQVTTLHAEHNPLFGGLNPEPIAKNYVQSAAWLAKNPHDLCLVTDGDADRVGGMLGDGGLLTTHQIICLLLRHYVVNRKQNRPRDQSAHDQHDGRSHVREIRAAARRDGGGLQIHRQRTGQGRRAARVRGKRRHRFPRAHSRARRHSCGTHVARTAGDRKEAAGEAAGGIRKGIWAASLRTP